MSVEDPLGDRMKLYEGQEAGRRFMPQVPIMARLDGRAFHTFCRGLQKPYDKGFHDLMVETLRFLVDETNAVVGYTQSDEISLCWFSDDPKSQVFFDGRIQKMTSVLAALATAQFNRLLPKYLPAKAHLMPVFDARVWIVPNQAEAANTFLWRENDASRNSILSAGQAQFSHKEMQGLGTNEVQEKLFQEKGINWNDYPDWAKRGTWLRRVRVTRAFTTDELDLLPAKHAARTNPNLQVDRSEIQRMVMPKFSSVINRVEALFQGDIPLVKLPAPPVGEPGYMDPPLDC